MRLIAILCSVFVLGLAGRGVGQDVVISEFMASNVTTLLDEDGDYSDWIEIYNAGPTAANLNGWYLTDDQLVLDKWRFPSVSVPADGFLVVFASDKDRRNPAGTLHTNFKLTTTGELLALVKPDGATIAFEYRKFPEQVEDFSYGLSMNSTLARLVRAGAPAKAFVPGNGSLGLTWTQPGFNDGAWLNGSTGVGYDRQPTYLPLIETDVGADMDGVNGSAYIRIPFTATNASSFSSLTLRMKYDDGFVAYLNGTKVADWNAPASPLWDSRATALHDDGDAVIFQRFDLGNAGGALREGTNVLAIHGLNENLGSSDFLILPELDAFDSGELDRSVELYFHQASPGFGNLPGSPGISEQPKMSRAGGVFTGAINVSLTTTSPSAEIRYTTDGSDPDDSSPLYSAPLRLTSSTLVRARGFEADLSPSPVISESYVALAADVQNYTSDLPIMILDSFGGGGIPASGYQLTYLAVFEPGTGRAALNRAPDVGTRAGIRLRGSSTQGQPKPNLALETWDERNADKDVALLGLPKDSDWVLHAPYNFDLALIRNPLIYELSNQVGRYATRHRFVELFINGDGGTLARADYVGVYVFMEKIKRGPARVDVESLSASVTSEPLITGGYMFKIDRLDPGDSGFSAAGQGMGYVYPKEEFVSPTQAAWIKDYLDDFYTALNGAQFANPTLGYAKYIDPDSWVDHHILNVLAKNVDALRLSTYYFKKRGRPIEAGPIWDFDRSMDSTDGRDDAPDTWDGTGDGTQYFTYPWWGRLFQDPNFWQRWRDRWYDARRGPLSTENMHAVIDLMADELRESQARNFQRWGLLGGRTWQGEINHLKQWLEARADWIDARFPYPPSFSSPGGNITPGFKLTITGTGSIYYALDGSDPRLPGGGTSPQASLYAAPITINDNARVIARVRRSSSDWSGYTAATFVVATPRLVISELMYHPLDPPAGSPYDADDFEFVELENAGASPLRLAGAGFTTGISFTFPAGAAQLGPGERVVLASNLTAFQTRYDTTGMRIGGEYGDRLNNAGEELALQGPLGEPILSFSFSDLWYPPADGNGFAMVFSDTGAPFESWGDQAQWEVGSVPGGTPGEDESGDPSLGGRQVTGDSNQDGHLDISDPMSLLLRLFLAGGLPLPCEGAGIDQGGNLLLLDVNEDLAVDLSDALHLLVYLFRQGPPPAGEEACRRLAGCPNVCSF